MWLGTGIVRLLREAEAKSGGRIWDRGRTFSIVPANGWVQVAVGTDDLLLIILMGPPSSRGNPTMAVTAFTDAMVSSLKLETHRDADIANHSKFPFSGYKAEHLGEMTVDGYPAIAWTASWRTLGATLKSQDVAIKAGNSLYSITYQGAIEDYDLQQEALKQMISSVRFIHSKRKKELSMLLTAIGRPLEDISIIEKAYKGENGFESGAVKIRMAKFPGGSSIYNSKMVQKVYDKIHKLPVIEQFYIKEQIKFMTSDTSISLKIDVNNDGKEEEVFITFYKPIDKEYVITQKNMETEETEILVYYNSILKYHIMQDRIIVIEYDNATLVEKETKSYSNLIDNKGIFKSMDALIKYVEKVKRSLANKPKVLEKTVTTRYTFHDPYPQKKSDPFKHLITKLKTNSVEISLDMHSFFKNPILRVTERYIIDYKYDKNGLLKSFIVFDNATSVTKDSQDAKGTLNRLENHVKGKKLFSYTLIKKNKELSLFLKKDLLTGNERVQVFDNMHGKRIKSQIYQVNDIDSKGKKVETLFTENIFYSPKHYNGFVPVVIYVYKNNNQNKWAVITTKDFDPDKQQLIMELKVLNSDRKEVYAWDFPYGNSIQVK